MSKTRFLKNMITPTKVEPSETHEQAVASGVWSLHDQYEANRGGLWPEAGVTNPSTLVENNFACTCYTGDGQDNRVLTTGIDLANNKGLIWLKSRLVGQNHILVDTINGAGKQLNSAQNDVQESQATTVKSFTTTGVTLGTHDRVNDGDDDEDLYVAWTFKAAPNFFDVVTYTGTGSARTVAHSLGSAPGSIWIKNLGVDDSWAVYHRANTDAPETDYLILDTEAETADSDAWWNDTAHTSSVFTVGTDHSVNADGENYVAYLFGHTTGSDSMIQCGGYTGNNNAVGTAVDLGFDPQWLFIRHTNQNGESTHIFDSIRGVPTGGKDVFTAANANQDEQTGADKIKFTASGFQLTRANSDLNGSGGKYVYIAVRSPMMKTYTDPTDVFAVDSGNNATASPFEGYTAGFPVDMWIAKLDKTNGSYSNEIIDRVRGATRNVKHVLEIESAAAEDDSFDGGYHLRLDSNTGINHASAQNLPNGIAWMWRRAKGYFDIVCYTGTGSAKTEAHQLGVVPEMMWVKCRSNGSCDWRIFEGADATNYLRFQGNEGSLDNAEFWNDTMPTASVFTVGTNDEVNGDGRTYVAYLFASLTGVSKIGRVDHSGSSTDVDCGFSSGSRFVMLKRTDSDQGTADWYIWDSVRGIASGNDPYMFFNTTGAQVTNTDLIDPLSSGFQISGDMTDGTYLFYAIA